MTTQNTNPFVLPGLGQAGEMGQNPLLASMEMMRQAWQGLAGSGALAPSGLGVPTSVEDLDRRIADMRAVENWLRMSLSMLTSTVQGLEVQRATIATLKAFVAAPAGEESAAGNPSPLEVALGLKPSGQAKIKTAHEPSEPAAAAGAIPGLPAGDPAQGWWNMLQGQFNALAAATAQSAEAMQAAAAPLAEQAAQAVEAATRAGAKPATAKPAKTAKPAASVRKAAARKTAPRKTRAAVKTRSSS